MNVHSAAGNQIAYLEDALATANERIRELDDELKFKLAELELMVRSRSSIKELLINEREVSMQAQADVKHFRDALAAEQLVSDKLLAAAKNLRDVKGRFHTEQAMKQLIDIVNQIEEQVK